MPRARGKPAGPADSDNCTGRGEDITRAVLERIPFCDITVADRGAGQYAVTLPSWAARELGIGTKSVIPEWHLSARLGTQAQVSEPARQPPGPLTGPQTSFTVTLHLGRP